MVQLIPNQPPLPLEPVYYLPHATTGTLLLQCLDLYNKCKAPTHKLFQALSIMSLNHQTQISLPTTQHNNLDFAPLSIMHFLCHMITIPTVTTIYTGGLNNQLIHQRFDHQSMEHIIKMKHGKIMNRLRTHITKFHDEYSYPICLLTKATKMKQNKTAPSRLNHKKGELLCMNYSLWNKPSIHGFTSLLSAICMTTRFSSRFPQDTNIYHRQPSHG